ncbi:MAG: hypothetical protein ABIE36_01120 [Candidatus Diapherotrites archaeon]
MDKNVNLENLSEEEAYELCLKLLDKANQDVISMNKSVGNTLNYCDNLDNFAKKYPLLAYNYLSSKN